jgi:hypothetical protein
MIRNDKRKYTEQLADKAQEAANLGNIKELYENKKLLSQRNWVRNKPIKDKQGVLITNKEKQYQRWKEHFQEVLNDHDGQTTPDNNQETNPNPIKTISIKPPSKTEIITAIRELKMGKAPSIDNVVPEALKIDPDLIAKISEPLLKEIWEQEELPNQWTKGIIIKLPKKGDLTNCNNWRGITLLSSSSKILSRIILNTIKRYIDNKWDFEKADHA